MNKKEKPQSQLNRKYPRCIRCNSADVRYNLNQKRQCGKCRKIQN